MDDDQILGLAAATLGQGRPTFSVKDFCFTEQVHFIDDPAPFKTAVCSRRSGKTVACAVHLISHAISNARRVCLYITLSRANAKRIIWADLLDINHRFNLKGKPNETELSITFPNRSVIYCSGAKDKTEIEKFRGLAISLCYIDECQSFRDYIRSLVDDIISKALFDYAGTLCLIGTPGPVPVGYFHECSQSKEWSHHAWTMFENPWLEVKSGFPPQVLLERELKRKGVTVNDPSIQRECFGKWVLDPDSLVFRYNAELNDYGEKPILPGAWEHVIGVDLGFEDSDAIGVIAWHPKVKETYLVEEIVTPKQGITALAAQLSVMIQKYMPIKIVMDTGGLGKKIAEEISARYSIPIAAAEKTRKFEFIEILNDAMRTRRFFAHKESRFAQDCFLVEWDKDATNPKISSSYHSDITDAVLYAFRESLHWLHEPEPVKIAQGSPKWLEQQEREMEESALDRIREKKEQETEDSWLGIGSDDGAYG